MAKTQKFYTFHLNLSNIDKYWHYIIKSIFIYLVHIVKE